MRVTLFWALALLCVQGKDIKLTGAKKNSKIEHVVVLMLENRSFDHLLGFLKRQNPRIDGCLPNEPGCSNPLRLGDPQSRRVTVNDRAEYNIYRDPAHNIPRIARQIYGDQPVDPSITPPMSGFVDDFGTYPGGTGEKIMDCFAPDSMPAITTLAREFAVFDRYFCSVPGPTFPNRMYANAATSRGMGLNDWTRSILGFPLRTTFQMMDEAELTWRVYFEQVPSVLFFGYPRFRLDRFSFMDSFFRDAAAGTLSTYNWLEPRYFDMQGAPANDMHPSNHDASEGDLLVKRIYEALRSSPKWSSTLFIITYDEHGGFFDHVPPPANVVNPDGMVETDPAFNFTRLGVRVPFIAVSPWLQRGIVENRGRNGAEYEHSSLPATMRKMFAPDFYPFSRRDEQAATFEHLFDTLSEPRDDCPKTLPTARRFRDRAVSPDAVSLGTTDVTGEVERVSLPTPDELGSTIVDNDFQSALVLTVAACNHQASLNANATLSEIEANWLPVPLAQMTEHQAARFVAEQMNLLLGRDEVPVPPLPSVARAVIA